MDAIAQLGSIFGLSFICGINLYATVAVVGLCVRNGWVIGLPPEFNILGNEAIIFFALILYFIEFFADKVQGVDILWDGLHTFIRPLGGALIALMQVGEASPVVEVIVFLLGASLASAAHATKASMRLLVNTSPEPVSNILVSLTEDAGAIGFSYLSLAYPKLTFFLTLGCLVLIVYFLPFVIRTFRMLTGAFIFRIKSIFVRDITKSALLSLPISEDTFFDSKKEKNERTIWTGRVFAVRVPGVRRYKRIYMIITSRSVYWLYRRWFRFHISRLARSKVDQHKCYRGRLLAKYLVKSVNGDYLVGLYKPLAKTLPQI